jgi:hypothetical protein
MQKKVTAGPEKRWRTRSQAIRLFLCGTTVRACLPVALVVGTLLSLVNQGDIIFSRQVSIGFWIKIGMNYIIPFCVSSYGFLQACHDK